MKINIDDPEELVEYGKTDQHEQISSGMSRE